MGRFQLSPPPRVSLGFVLGPQTDDGKFGVDGPCFALLILQATDPLCGRRFQQKRWDGNVFFQLNALANWDGNQLWSAAAGKKIGLETELLVRIGPKPQAGGPVIWR